MESSVMARNVEIKARIQSIELLQLRAAALGARGPNNLEQDDTFFACDSGRLKLREFADGTAELIYYRRPDQAGPKESFYLVTPLSSAEPLRESLRLAYGIIGRVRKRRILYLAGRTRIHLDRVENLGDFIELEVVLDESETVEFGVSEAHRLLRALEIQPDQLIDVAYVDLLASARAS